MKNNGHYNSAQNTYYINFETDKSSNRVLLKIIIKLILILQILLIQCSVLRKKYIQTEHI